MLVCYLLTVYGGIYVRQWGYNYIHREIILREFAFKAKESSARFFLYFRYLHIHGKLCVQTDDISEIRAVLIIARACLWFEFRQ